MSLFLRQACQSRLDDVGLENYHIQVDEGSKCLQVVGECGDVLASITGIRLSRMAPADKEIALAVDLFDNFLAKHTATFKAFISAKARADKAKIPTAEDMSGLLEVEIAKPYYREEVRRLKFLMTENTDTCVEVKSTGEVIISQMSFNLHEDETVSIICSLTPVEEQAIRYWVKECSEYNEAVEDKTALLTLLSSCEI